MVLCGHGYHAVRVGGGIVVDVGDLLSCQSWVRGWGCPVMAAEPVGGDALCGDPGEAVTEAFPEVVVAAAGERAVVAESQ